MTHVLAVVCVRNESLHIRRCLRDLIADGIDVVLIDNDSSDDTVAKARRFLGRGLLGIERLPWRGAFSLTEQLAAKAAVVAAASHEWIVHADADEWLTARADKMLLREAIDRADAAGYTCINFNEFVFIPLPGEDFATETYSARMRTYYFFEPAYPRLVRAWRRDSAHLDPASGGHLVSGRDVRRSPEDLILRHYVMLSATHGRRKYLDRRYAAEDVAQRFHHNRLTITDESLWVAERPGLRTLPYPSSRAFDRSAPQRRHFWEWNGPDDSPGAQLPKQRNVRVLSVPFE